jgi:hypothetical protein
MQMITNINVEEISQIFFIFLFLLIFFSLFFKVTYC